MLLGKLYQINETRSDENGDIVNVSFDASHEIFKGHFPHLPVVPGVCQLQMLEEVVSQLTSKAYHIKEAHQVKFLALLNPVKSKNVILEIARSVNEEGSLSVVAKYYDDKETFFRFKGSLHE